MKLNERIYALRAERKLSQGDLAEALGVSRQSISKWETGAAVPEIEHLVRLSEIFGVTLDELVKGEAPAPREEILEGATETPRTEAGTVTHTTVILRAREPRKTAALVLLILGCLSLFFTLLGAGTLGLLIAIPLFLCALVCVLFRRRVGLWCNWTVLILVNIYLGLTTGVLNFWWAYLMSTLLGLGTGDFPINVQFFVSVLITLWELGTIGLTVYSYRKERLSPTRKHLILVIGGWVLLIGLRILSAWIAREMVISVESALPFGLYRFFNMLYHVVQIGGFTAMLTLTVALVRGWMDKEKDTRK